MYRPKSSKQGKKKRAWEEEVGNDDGDGDEASDVNATPSEAFLSLQKDLEEKEKIQKGNEEKAKNFEKIAAKAANSLQMKEKVRRANVRNPKVFLDIEIADDNGSSSRLKKGKSVGRITLELFEDVVPRTAENFRALCTGEKPRGLSGFPLSFLGNIFHRIVPKFMAQGGDITREDGSGGESIYGATFNDESFQMKHDRGGLLSMANSGRHSNNSQFFITFDPLPWLDSKHVVFGKVVEGMNVVRLIEDCGTSSGEPTRRVQIADCGQIPFEDEGEDDRKSDHGGQEDDGDGGGQEQHRMKRQKVRFAKGGSPDAPPKENVKAGSGGESGDDETADSAGTTPTLEEGNRRRSDRDGGRET